MIFYRLALQRVIGYLKLDQLFGDDLHQIRRHKRQRDYYLTRLKTDNTLNLYVSVLLSIIGSLLSLTLPYAMLEDPCQFLKDNNLHLLYRATRFIESNLDILDYFIVVFALMLFYLMARTVVDAVGRTKINKCPWSQRGTDTIF